MERRWFINTAVMMIMMMRMTTIYEDRIHSVRIHPVLRLGYL